MTVPASPEMQVGMQALSVALQAKNGELDREAVDRLEQLAAELMPDDAEASAAVERFLGTAFDDPVAAGAALFTFVIRLSDRLCLRPGPEPGDWRDLDGHALPRAEYDWQRRADING